MKKIWNKYDYFFKCMAFYAFVCAIMISCECDKKSHKTQQKPPATRKSFSNAYNVDEVRHVNEKGIHYVVVYSNGVSIVNYTKDSLEIERLKAQQYKDSLQIEVFKQYLQK